ncbi:polysaccharide deacetylase family protein [Companilactobacillus insicii]|uniref:polysaccharide deacetylase family protein n=1 Tax=Companilactobacillus insicii TaxID=1732567 RepID=UPI000F7A8F8D|nr:polysaccharide deacetylase family protein [Companilactobacillus insicii]
MKKLIVLLTAILMGTICLPAQEVSASSNKINTQRISKKWKKSKVKIKFPILMYHSIASTGNSLNVPIEQFEEEITYLKSHHYYFLSPHEAYTVLKTNKKPRKNIVWLTLDDGYKNNFDVLKNLYKNYHAKATVFDIINSQNGGNFLSHYQLKNLKRSHIAIQNHTFHHMDLDKLDQQKQVEEMSTGKDNLDTLLSQKTIALAYEVPYNC